MTWLIGAYAIVWVAVLLYAYGLDRKQKALALELEALKSKVERST
jgi:CcmD family protein